MVKKKKMTPSTFATPDAPLRGSSLETFMGTCAGFTVSRMLGERDEGGVAAHTGTAIGRAIEITHQTGGKRKTFADIMAQVRKESEEGTPGSDDQASFAKANWTEVEGMLKGYRADRRNNVKVIEDSLEEVVKLELPPHPLDPTGEPVYLTGHLDQVRYDVVSGSYRVWDVKSGKGGGTEMTSRYKWQVACYVLGYRAKYPNRKVNAGGIINVRDYITNRTIKNPDYDPKAPKMNPAARKRIKNPDASAKLKTIPNPVYDPDADKVNPASRKTIVLEDPGEYARVFYPLPLVAADYERLMNEVTRQVALVRAGYTPLNPDAFWCGLCPNETFNKCHQVLKRKKFAV